MQDNQTSKNSMKYRFTPILILLLGLGSLKSQTHDYPRIGIMHFGRVNEVPEWWYSRFDYLLLRTTRSSKADAIHALNPDAVVIGVQDWNRGAPVQDPPRYI